MLIYGIPVKEYSKMKIFRNLFNYQIAIYIFVISSSYAIAEETVNCNTSKVLDKIRANVNSIRDYQLVSHVNLNGNKVTSNISGKLPNLMRINMQISQNQSTIDITTTFNGTYQWNVTKYTNAIEISKIELKNTTNIDHPFDTSFYVMGSGLVNGEDYPTSVKTLLDVYTLTASCNQSNIELSGTVNTKNFKSYMGSKKNTTQLDARVKQYTASFPKIRMIFDSHSLALKEYDLGTSKQPTSFVTKLENLSINKGLKSQFFTFTPPKNQKVVDITKEVLSQIQ